MGGGLLFIWDFFRYSAISRLLYMCVYKTMTIHECCDLSGTVNNVGDTVSLVNVMLRDVMCGFGQYWLVGRNSEVIHGW